MFDNTSEPKSIKDMTSLPSIRIMSVKNDRGVYFEKTLHSYGLSFFDISDSANFSDLARKHSLSFSQILHVSSEFLLSASDELRKTSERISKLDPQKRFDFHIFLDLVSGKVSDSINDEERSAFKTLVNRRLPGILSAALDFPEFMIENGLSDYEHKIAQTVNKKERKVLEEKRKIYFDRLIDFFERFSAFTDIDTLTRTLVQHPDLINEADKASDGPFFSLLVNTFYAAERSDVLFDVFQRSNLTIGKIYHSPNDSYFYLFEQLTEKQKMDFLGTYLPSKGGSLFESLLASDPNIDITKWLVPFLCSENDRVSDFAVPLLDAQIPGGKKVSSALLDRLFKENDDFFFTFLAFLNKKAALPRIFNGLLSDKAAFPMVRKVLSSDFALEDFLTHAPAFSDYLKKDGAFLQSLSDERLKEIAPFIPKNILSENISLFQILFDCGSSLPQLSYEEQKMLAFVPNPETQLSLFDAFLLENAENERLYTLFSAAPSEQLLNAFKPEQMMFDIAANKLGSVDFLLYRLPKDAVLNAFIDRNPLVLSNKNSHAEMFKAVKRYLLENDPEILRALEKELHEANLLSSPPSEPKKSFRILKPVQSAVKATPGNDASPASTVISCYPHFKNQFNKIDPWEFGKVYKAVLEIVSDPFIGDIKTTNFSGSRGYKFNIGQTPWRIVYKINDDGTPSFACVGKRRAFYTLNDLSEITKAAPSSFSLPERGTSVSKKLVFTENAVKEQIPSSRFLSL